MTRQEGLKANEMFFNGILSMLHEGGCWVFPAIMQPFFKKNGKLVAATKEAYNYVLNITPQNIHNIFEYDLSIGNPQLN